jgi:hypothetical protein
MTKKYLQNPPAHHLVTEMSNSKFNLLLSPLSFLIFSCSFFVRQALQFLVSLHLSSLLPLHLPSYPVMNNSVAIRIVWPNFIMPTKFWRHNTNNNTWQNVILITKLTKLKRRSSCVVITTKGVNLILKWLWQMFSYNQFNMRTKALLAQIDYFHTCIYIVIHYPEC